MNFRKRKKKPPDPGLPPSVSLIARRSCVDLTMSLAHSQRDLQAVPLSCSWMHLPSTSIQAGFSVQFSCVCDGLVGLPGGILPLSQRFLLFSLEGSDLRLSSVFVKMGKFVRMYLLSSTIQAGLSVQTSCVGDGLVGFTQWNSSTFPYRFSYSVKRIQICDCRAYLSRWANLFGRCCFVLIVGSRSVSGMLLSPSPFSYCLMECSRVFYSSVLRNINYGPCDCQNVFLNLTWSWHSLSLTWLVGVEIPDVTEAWHYNLQFGFSKLCSLMFWKLAPYGYGFVISQRRPSGSAGVLLNFFTIASLPLICFIAWISLLFFRHLLYIPYYFKYLSPFTLLDLSIRMVHAMLMVHVNFFLFHYWGYASLIQLAWRLLFDRVLLALLHPFSHLPRLFERVLDHHTLYYFLLECSDLDQHVFMLGPRPWTLVLPLYGYWPFCSRLSDVRSEHSLYWVLPLFLLSLGLVNLYAQKHVFLCTCFCWCLVFLQTAGDEVKGVCPFVYEVMLSEKRTSVPLAIFTVYFSRSRNFGTDPSPLFSVLVLWACLFGVLVHAYEDGLTEARISSSSTSSRDSKSNVFLGPVQIQVEWFTCFSWPLFVVKLLWVVLQVNLDNSLLHVLRSGIRLAASRREVEVQVIMLGVQTLVLVFLFGLYWICMMAECQVIFVNVAYVNRSNECTILLSPHQNMSVVWTITHLCCVIGPCLRALEWHLRMLGYACKGLSDSRWLDSFFIRLF